MDIQQPKPKVWTKQQAQLKAESFCAYQERAQQEVRNKLYEWGLHSADVEEIISELITQNFLNEERFAFAYTIGKFRMKGWGKIKIKQNLRLKKISEKLIQKSLQKIDETDYINKLQLMLEKKSDLISEKNSYKKQYKLIQYALSRGYEKDLIMDTLKNNKLS
ncbi:regulatory protein RecX [Daejeonella oryzae]|uniref:regulatory protein RecX n=1 Tax=Daejeonella oryzae TaxID=1122943 RepID=UPI00047DF7EA|nr:regulatory protein RecX [Daejeonella oryzae]